MPSSASIPSPNALGERNSTASSMRSAARNAADRIGPASTMTRVMPRPARPRSTAPRAPGLAVGRHGELERDMRAPIAHVPDVAGMHTPRLFGADPDIDHDALGA